MKILLTSILLFYVCHSKAQKTLISEEDAYNFNMHKVLTKNAKRLEKMKFSKAVKKMGKPFEIEKRKISSLSLPDTMLREYFLEYVDEQKDSYLLEVYWKRLADSWITV